MAVGDMGGVTPTFVGREDVIYPQAEGTGQRGSLEYRVPSTERGTAGEGRGEAREENGNLLNWRVGQGVGVWVQTARGLDVGEAEISAVQFLVDSENTGESASQSGLYHP